MATRYWVGGTASWDGTAGFKWAIESGGAGGYSAPTSVDTVYFDSNSGSGVVTIAAGNGGASNVYLTDFAGTVAGSANITIRSGLSIGSGVTWNYSGNITLGSNGNYGQLNTSGKTIASLTINTGTTAAGVTLSDSLIVGNLSLISGFFESNNYGITVTESVNSSGTGARILNLGNGIWNFTGSGTVWDCATATNLSVSSGSSTFKFTSGSAKTFQGGGRTYNIISNEGAGALTISGSNTFTTLQNTVQPTTFTFTAGTTQTVTNFNVNGTSGNLVTINSSSAGSQATISKSSGTVTASYLAIQDINATGGATWDATNGTNTNLGNNAGWIFPGNMLALFM